MVQVGEEPGRVRGVVPVFQKITKTGVIITAKPKNLITKCHQWCTEKSRGLWKYRKSDPIQELGNISLEASLKEEVELMEPEGKGREGKQQSGIYKQVVHN